MCDAVGATRYWRWPVNPKTREVLPVREDVKEIQSILGDPSITKVWYNHAYDYRMLTLSSFSILGGLEDTMFMMHTITGGNELRYALKPLSVKYLGYPEDDEKALQEATIKARNKGKKLGWCLATKDHQGKEPIKADYWMAPPELCKEYAIGDVERTMMLYLHALPELQKNQGMMNIYQMELQLAQVIRRMENTGTRMFPKDNKRLRVFYEGYKREQIKLSDRNGGKGLNPRSSKQMHAKFYGERKNEVRLNDKGRPKLDAGVLLELSRTDKLAKILLEYTAADRTLGTLDIYDRFRTEQTPGTWILHPNFRQTGAVTGRMSCSDPNLMNIASADTGRQKADINYRQREVFGPRSNHVWYLPDYSQIEIWVFAFLSQDPGMMKAMLSGYDAHGAIAKEVWGHLPDYEEAKKYYRKRAKLVMFCWLYGGGHKKLAILLESTLEAAAQADYDLAHRFPGAKRFMKRMINRATREGTISNPFGRVYFFEEHYAYKAVNYLVQGTSADLFKRALIRLDRLFRSKWEGTSILLPLHDEIIIEVPKKYHSKKLMREIIHEMQADSHLLGIPKPLPVGMKITTHRWSSTQDVTV